MEGMITAFFQPHPDITAFELAKIVAHCGFGAPPKNGVYFKPSDWDNLDADIKRHFVVKT